MNNEELIHIDFDKYTNDSNIICYEDFYIKSDILDIVAPEKGKYHYSNIQANEKTVKRIDDLLEYNLIHTKNKYSKMYKEQYLKSIAGLDRLTWSPKINNEIEDDIIRIFLPSHPEYILVDE